MLRSSLSPSLSFHWVSSPHHTQLSSPTLLLRTDLRRLKIIQNLHHAFCVLCCYSYSGISYGLNFVQNEISIPFMVSVNIWTFQTTVYPVFSWWSIFWNLSSQKIKHAENFSLIVYMLQWKTAHANFKKIKSSFRKICNTQKNSDTICDLYFLHYLLWSLMLSSIMALSGLSTLILLVS